MGKRIEMRIIALVVLAATGGCNGSTVPDENVVQTAGGTRGNPTSYHARLKAMPDTQRAREFILAARAAQERCEEITRMAAPQSDEAIPIWTVNCADGGRLAMVLNRERVEQVLRTRPPTPPVPAIASCARLVGSWTNGAYKTINVSQEGSNFLIVYELSPGQIHRFVGPCENDRIVTHTDWVGDLSYIPSSNSAIFERETFFRR